MNELNDTQGLVTLRDWIRWGTSRFEQAQLYYGHGTDNAFDEALALVLHALHLDHQIPEAFLDSRLTATEQRQILELLKGRVETRKPAAYLMEHGYFAGLPFYVNDAVLVPRSPIAELILAEFQPWLGERAELHVLDLCTGSGCIALAAAHYLPQAIVDASDVSDAALDVARVNLNKHQLQDRVTLYQSDLFDALPGRQYDLIVSNPPYVDAQDMAALPEEYRREPELGLAAGDDGLDIVKRILSDAGQYLKSDGVLIVEVGNSEVALQNQFPQVPFLWLEFEHGGHGVFLLTAAQLAEHFG
ncbi:MAG: 50S ribosomal protein L3 N(5)-glutamine methyltransferase [bacterium]